MPLVCWVVPLLAIYAFFLLFVQSKDTLLFPMSLPCLLYLFNPFFFLFFLFHLFCIFEIQKKDALRNLWKSFAMFVFPFFFHGFFHRMWKVLALYPSFSYLHGVFLGLLSATRWTSFFLWGRLIQSIQRIVLLHCLRFGVRSSFMASLQIVSLIEFNRINLKR